MSDRELYFVGEMEWALNQINCFNHDRNPNRQAQLQAAISYGLTIGICLRNGSKVKHAPKPPEMDKIC